VGGEPVALTRNSALYYVHADQLGRPEAVTGAVKTVAWRAKNFAFDRTVSTDTLGGLNAGFPGQYFDIETGSWYNVNRDYDSVVGRYLESDPIGLRSGTNPYAYVRSSPTTGFDPLGLVDLNLFGPQDPLHQNANAVPSPEGVFTVGAHGTPTDVRNASNQPLSADQLADQIENDPRWKDGMRVELDACNTANDPGDGGEPFAAKLADAMGVPVSGANNFVWIYPNGNVLVAPIAPSGGPNLTNPGGFMTYVPISH
jgi:RHS repeat-associated protein